MSNNPVAESLKKVLASSYILSLKTQNYHWNVKGPHFKQLHDLFGEQYNELNTAIDDIAERIRALGINAPANYSTYQSLSEIEDGKEDQDSISMVKDLANDQKKIVDDLNIAIQVAQKASDESTADLAIGRITAHEKNRWMLESSL
jgi:starvation-inducible DNA-binding protein